MIGYIIAFVAGWFVSSKSESCSALYTFFRDIPSNEPKSIITPIVNTLSFLLEYVFIRIEQWLKRSLIWESGDFYTLTYIIGRQTYKLRVRRIAGPASRTISAWERGARSIEAPRVKID